MPFYLYGEPNFPHLCPILAFSNWVHVLHQNAVSLRGPVFRKPYAGGSFGEQALVCLTCLSPSYAIAHIDCRNQANFLTYSAITSWTLMLIHDPMAHILFVVVVHNSCTGCDAGTLSRCVIGEGGQRTMKDNQQFSSIFCPGMTPHIRLIGRCSIQIHHLRTAAILVTETATVIEILHHACK